MDATYWIIGLLAWIVVGLLVAAFFGRMTGPREERDEP